MSNNVSIAIVLAAGMGSRLRPLTSEVPKCLVEVCGRPLLHWMLDEIEGLGIDRLIVATGYRSEQVREQVALHKGGLTTAFVHSPHYAVTNNIVTLERAMRHALSERRTSDVLIIESDLLLQPGLLSRLSGANALAVARHDPTHMDGTVVTVGPGHRITRMYVGGEDSPGTDVSLWKTVNVTRLGRREALDVSRRLSAALGRGETGRYYEVAIAEGIAAGSLRLRAVDFSGASWFEVDTLGDLQRARAGHSATLVEARVTDSARFSPS